MRDRFFASSSWQHQVCHDLHSSDCDLHFVQGMLTGTRGSRTRANIPVLTLLQSSDKCAMILTVFWLCVSNSLAFLRAYQALRDHFSTGGSRSKIQFYHVTLYVDFHKRHVQFLTSASPYFRVSSDPWPSLPEPLVFTVFCAGDYIDVIHREWYTDYDRLEEHHGFIQWYATSIWLMTPLHVYWSYGVFGLSQRISFTFVSGL